MPSRMSRRGFLATAASAASAAQSKPMNKLGLDLFSLRGQGWTAFEMLDFCAKNGVEVAHFSELRFLGSIEADHLKRVREHADRLGISLEVGFGSICETSTRFMKEEGTAAEQLVRAFGIAKILGSPFVRCYLGGMDDRKGDLPFEAHIENTIKSCKAVRERALENGIKIAIENHAGDMQALQLKALIEEAGTDYVGALLDPGNASWTLEDPLHTLETLAPLALTTGIRDSRIWETDEGAAVMWVPLGQGNIDIRRWHARFVELRPDLPFSLEIIHLPRPRMFAYRNREFWNDYDEVPAWVFAGFLNLARKGEPYEPANDPTGADQQRKDVEADLAFCRREFGLGRSSAV